MKQVICIHWGTKYGPPYVNTLYAMVARNITGPFTFTCFCDDPAGFRPEIRTKPLPAVDYEIPRTRRGIWPKSRLWGPELGGLAGPVLFLDLDVVITGSLDPFFEVGDPGDLVMARNPGRPWERLGQTSVFRFEVGSLTSLQKIFAADPVGIAEEYGFEQRFVTRNAPGGARFFPRDWVVQFRRECRWPLPLNYVLRPRLPESARVVLFAGHLGPDDAAAGRYGPGRVDEAGAHLRKTFSADRRGTVLEHLRHYIRPTPWVAEHWRE